MVVKYLYSYLEQLFINLEFMWISVSVEKLAFIFSTKIATFKFNDALGSENRLSISLKL